MHGDDQRLPHVFTRAQARAAGWTDRQIDRRLASGGFERLRRGVAREAAEAGEGVLLPPDVAAALISCSGREVAISHASAARLLALPKPLAGWGNPQFTAASGPTRTRAGVHIRVAPLPHSDVFWYRGAWITKPARTVFDCLRTLPPRDGLAILDAALHHGLVQMERLLAVLEHQQGWPGTRIARRVLMLGDERRESPLESWSAWAFSEAGVPGPEWQVEIRDAGGVFVARTDCWWPGVAGEADGRSKYALAAAQRSGSGADALFDVLGSERRREQRLRATGADMVRWCAADVLDPSRTHGLAATILAALAQARNSLRFTGRAAPVVLPLATVNGPSQPPQRWSAGA